MDAANWSVWCNGRLVLAGMSKNEAEAYKVNREATSVGSYTVGGKEVKVAWDVRYYS